jgi:hypothetical protein
METVLMGEHVAPYTTYSRIWSTTLLPKEPLKMFKEGMNTASEHGVLLFPRILSRTDGNMDRNILANGQTETTGILRLESMTHRFAVKRGYNCYLKKKHRKSCFYEFSKNALITKYQGLDVSQITRDTVEDMWDEARINELNRISTQYKTAFVFKGRGPENLATFLASFYRIPRETQRSMILWLFGKSGGRWKKCGRCGQPADKKHMEQCILQLPCEQVLSKVDSTAEIWQVAILLARITNECLAQSRLWLNWPWRNPRDIDETWWDLMNESKDTRTRMRIGWIDGWEYNEQESLLWWVRTRIIVVMSENKNTMDENMMNRSTMNEKKDEQEYDEWGEE